ncbi:periplasmic component [Pseudomonas syringae pv. actinidiae]|uniref:Periplasmic component n=1 Tax=Pseudomonas syringae pv. actinidiae TaxID=103796 RepID=A0A2V0QB01_PSESF|nr:periplasmic component [Pseudomonas syringae pv. actinidiae]
MTRRKLFHTDKGRRKFSDRGGQAPDSVLIFLLQYPVVAQDRFLDDAEIFDRHRCAFSGQHVQHIYTLGRYSSQIIGLGGTVTIFILSLSVSFDASYFTESSLGHAQTFSFFS